MKWGWAVDWHSGVSDAIADAKQLKSLPVRSNSAARVAAARRLSPCSR